MSLLDDIRRDMAQGTPGPWCNSQLDAREIEVAESGQPVGETYGRNDETLANARRCARVPDMEKALLAWADAMRKADEAIEMGDPEVALTIIDTAFRAATE